MYRVLDKNNNLRIFCRFLSHFSRKRKIQLLGIVVIMIIGGYAELLSLSAVVPFLSILNNPTDSLKSNLLKIYPIPIENLSNQNLLIFACSFFVITIILAGVLKFTSLYLIGKFYILLQKNIN